MGHRFWCQAGERESHKEGRWQKGRSHGVARSTRDGGGPDNLGRWGQKRRVPTTVPTSRANVGPKRVPTSRASVGPLLGPRRGRAVRLARTETC
jgi:hypothetical protein